MSGQCKWDYSRTRCTSILQTKKKKIVTERERGRHSRCGRSWGGGCECCGGGDRGFGRPRNCGSGYPGVCRSIWGCFDRKAAAIAPIQGSNWCGGKSRNDPGHCCGMVWILGIGIVSDTGYRKAQPDTHLPSFQLTNTLIQMYLCHRRQIVANELTGEETQW